MGRLVISPRRWHSYCREIANEANREVSMHPTLNPHCLLWKLLLNVLSPGRLKIRHHEVAMR